MNTKCLVLAAAVLSGLLPVRLQADPLDQCTWRNPLPTGNTRSALAYGNNQFVAVGNTDSSLGQA
jgi:hypothetical protein